MKLAEIYSNSLSVDINPESKPDLPSSFYPTPEKYLTIQNSSGMPAKDYDFFQNVINLIYPFLQKENIEILQIGSGQVRGLNKVINLTNQTNFSQSVYILKNSLLHFGNDSFACHAACTTPLVALYGSTSVSAHSPYFYHEKSIFIESHRLGRNPSFQAQENPKTINFIPPEQVAAAILKILEIKNEINQKTILVGDLYVAPCLEVVPDFIINPQNFPPGHVNLRADLFFDVNLIIENLRRRPFILHLDRPIDANILKQLKQNIPLVIYEIDETTDVNYLNLVIRAGIPLQLITKMPPTDHDKIKLKYLDLPLVVRRDDINFDYVTEKIKVYNNLSSEAAATFVENLKNQSLKYYSNKLLLSGDKLYLSLMDWKLGKNVENPECSSAADLNNQEFVNEINHFLIFSENL